MKQYLLVHCKAFASPKKRSYLNLLWEIYARQSVIPTGKISLCLSLCATLLNSGISCCIIGVMFRCVHANYCHWSQPGWWGVWEGTGWCNSCGGMPTLFSDSLSSELFPSVRRLMKTCHMKIFEGVIWKGSPFFPALGLNILQKCGTQNQTAFSSTLEY